MIKKDSVVSLAYILKDEKGQIIDQASAQDAFSYLHGHSQIVPGLEDALMGLTIGTKKNIVIQPSQGYGEFIPDLRMELNRSQFPENEVIEKGMQFISQDPDGNEVQFSIVNVEGEKVTVDGNHPLAGATLYFDVEVVQVRDATEEELMHGHAHGPDGHHHH